MSLTYLLGYLPLSTRAHGGKQSAHVLWSDRSGVERLVPQNRLATLLVLLQIVGPSVLLATVMALVKVGLLRRLLDLLRPVRTL